LYETVQLYFFRESMNSLIKNIIENNISKKKFQFAQVLVHKCQVTEWVKGHRRDASRNLLTTDTKLNLIWQPLAHTAATGDAHTLKLDHIVY